MKKNLTILFILFCFFGYSQQTNIGGNLNVTGNIINEPPHTLWAFRDSATTITAGTNVQITNAFDSIFRVMESSSVTYKRGDTGIILKKGGYNINVNVRGSGNNGADWAVTYAKKSGVSTTYGTSIIEFSTDGTSNFRGGGFQFYVECIVGDKIWLVISRVGGTGDFTLRTGNFNIQNLYIEN